ncbi:MAG: CDP-alcohol phosphatidyltransferase family protein [Halioglobus sp.]|nr:CDP-alcohol phosphatidyltransferase family protein [Halioglobus sp.]
MANLVTLSRLLLLWLVVALVYFATPPGQLLAVVLLILVFVTDGIDGYIARRTGTESLFGALFDIAADRIVELSLWIVLVDLDLVPLWVPLLFITRGVLVDAIRDNGVQAQHTQPFQLMQTPVGRWLVAGRFMRGFYAVIKAIAFCWMILMLPLPVLWPDLWNDWSAVLMFVGLTFVYLSTLLCVLRGAPVIIEFLLWQGRGRG